MGGRPGSSDGAGVACGTRDSGNDAPMHDYFLADDLSGALDAAAAFHRAGRSVRVILSADAWREVCQGEVVGITTETRNAAPELAATAVRQVLAEAKQRG